MRTEWLSIRADEVGGWQACGVQDTPRRKPLLQDRGILRLRDVGERTGVSVDRLEALIDAGLIPDALFDSSGKPLYLFEDSVPSREQLLDLLSSLGE